MSRAVLQESSAGRRRRQSAIWITVAGLEDFERRHRERIINNTGSRTEKNRTIRPGEVHRDFFETEPARVEWTSRAH